MFSYLSLFLIRRIAFDERIRDSYTHREFPTASFCVRFLPRLGPLTEVVRISA
jgi:hypothetical protein